MVWNSSTISQQTARSPKAIVDSGTTLNYLPTRRPPFFFTPPFYPFYQLCARY